MNGVARESCKASNSSGIYLHLCDDDNDIDLQEATSTAELKHEIHRKDVGTVFDVASRCWLQEARTLSDEDKLSLHMEVCKETESLEFAQRPCAEPSWSTPTSGSLVYVLAGDQMIAEKWPNHPTGKTIFNQLRPTMISNPDNDQISLHYYSSLSFKQNCGKESRVSTPISNIPFHICDHTCDCLLVALYGNSSRP